MSAESGKAVERFNCTNGGAQFCQGCYTMKPDSEGEYVRHEDYAKLEQQRAALVEALDPQTIEAIADEIGSAEHSARAESLRGIARRQRAALKAAGEGL